MLPGQKPLSSRNWHILKAAGHQLHQDMLKKKGLVNGQGGSTWDDPSFLPNTKDKARNVFRALKKLLLYCIYPLVIHTLAWTALVFYFAPWNGGFWYALGGCLLAFLIPVLGLVLPIYLMRRKTKQTRVDTGFVDYGWASHAAEHLRSRMNSLRILLSVAAMVLFLGCVSQGLTVLYFLTNSTNRNVLGLESSTEHPAAQSRPGCKYDPADCTASLPEGSTPSLGPAPANEDSWRGSAQQSDLPPGSTLNRGRNIEALDAPESADLLTDRAKYQGSANVQFLPPALLYICTLNDRNTPLFSHSRLTIPTIYTNCDKTSSAAVQPTWWNEWVHYDRLQLWGVNERDETYGVCRHDTSTTAQRSFTNVFYRPESVVPAVSASLDFAAQERSAAFATPEIGVHTGGWTLGVFPSNWHKGEWPDTSDPYIRHEVRTQTDGVSVQRAQEVWNTVEASNANTAWTNTPNGGMGTEPWWRIEAYVGLKPQMAGGFFGAGSEWVLSEKLFATQLAIFDSVTTPAPHASRLTLLDYVTLNNWGVQWHYDEVHTDEQTAFRKACVVVDTDTEVLLGPVTDADRDDGYDYGYALKMANCGDMWGFGVFTNDQFYYDTETNEIAWWRPWFFDSSYRLAFLPYVTGSGESRTTEGRTDFRVGVVHQSWSAYNNHALKFRGQVYDHGTDGWACLLVLTSLLALGSSLYAFYIAIHAIRDLGRINVTMHTEMMAMGY
ncbi:unnamed protein product [Amoebophrya sp. A120]|nr:unnamed protein product [Amoebophrya sp. A120]|eukprot:GSA120T00016572001.1